MKLTELQQRFRPRFVADARQRVARMRDHLIIADGEKLCQELHLLSGEAVMIGFQEVAGAARAAERAARGLAGGRDPRAALECRRQLGRIAEAVESLAEVRS